MLIYATTDHNVEKMKELKRLNEEKIPPYAQVQLYQQMKSNLDKVLEHQLSDEAKSKYFSRVKIKNADETLMQKHAFLGKAKYRNFLIFLDDDGNLITIKNLE